MDPRIPITLAAVLHSTLFVGGGLALAAAIYDWPWLFEGWPSLRGLAERIGRGRARLLCGLLGAALIVIALIRMTRIVALPGA